MRFLLASLVLSLGGAFARADDAGVDTDVRYLLPRCHKLLKLQRAIRDESIQLAKQIAERKEQSPVRADEQQARALAEREAVVVLELRKTLQLIEADGTVVAFEEPFGEMRDKAVGLQRRFGKIDLSKATLALQDELIAVLKEAIEDLEEPQMS